MSRDKLDKSTVDRCVICRASKGKVAVFPSNEELVEHLKTEHDINLDTYINMFGASIRRSIGQAKRREEERKQRSEHSEEQSVQRHIDSEEEDKTLRSQFQRITTKELVKRFSEFGTDKVEKLRDHIPQKEAVVFDPRILKKLYLAVSRELPVYIWGPKGTSKTYTVVQLAAEIGQPLIRINGVGDMRTSHFVGRIAGRDGTTFWKDGLLPKAMKNGAWILVDEVDIAPPQILNVLQSVLDSRTMVIEDTGEKVVAHPAFRMFFTANTPGRGDFTGLYHGTRPLNDSFLDRIGVWIKADIPGKAIIQSILSKHFPEADESMISSFSGFIHKLAVTLSREGSNVTISIRHALSMMQFLVDGFFIEDALDMTIYDSLADPQDVVAIKMVVSNILPEFRDIPKSE